MHKEEICNILSEQMKILHTHAKRKEITLGEQMAIAYVMTDLAESIAKVGNVTCMVDLDDECKIKAVKPIGKTI